MIELDAIEVSRPCTSCGVASFSTVTFGGQKCLPLCEFCKEVLRDLLEEDLEV